MRVIPVIDLMSGVVVRGIAGQRNDYRPIHSKLVGDSQPATAAREFAREFGFGTVYVADLEAIQHGRYNTLAWQQIAASGLKLWLDAGIGTSAGARAAVEQLAYLEIDARLVIGLESLVSEIEMRGIAELCFPHRPIFSLDLQAGRPLARNPAWQNLPPLEIALLAASWGIGELIVLDLADVGTAGGTRTLDLCRQIRHAAPLQAIVAGGGVRDLADLQALADAGCNAALVASALHDGRLTAADLAEFRS